MDDNIIIDPQEIADFIRKNEEISEKKSKIATKYLSALTPEDFIKQLKHLLYRNVQNIEIMSQSIESLSLSEKILLESTDSLFNGVLYAMKWIALNNGIDYNEKFGDSFLVQKIGDFVLGEQIDENINDSFGRLSDDNDLFNNIFNE